MPNGFQTQVYPAPAVAIPGDFASMNPYASFDAGPGGLVAGSDFYVGRFAWVYPPQDPNGTAQVANCIGNGPVAGFVHGELQADIVTYLGYATMKVLPGKNVTLHIAGDYWVKNDGAAFATVGMKAFAILATGQVRFAAAGTIVGGASATGSDIAAASGTFTGSISGNILTVTAITDPVYPGATLAGSGIVGSPKVQRQISGTPNGIGTYYVDVQQPTAVASTTITATHGVLTIGTATGTFEVGDILTGTNVVAGTTITQFLTGAGGTGSTAVVQFNTVVGSTTITASDAVETKWYARSSGPQNSMVKISSFPIG